MFQSRNRGSFDFKFSLVFWGLGFLLFQSRNRGSFDFKPWNSHLIVSVMKCFNLVIEVLLISSLLDACLWTSETYPFQSRNRGSFDFKIDFWPEVAIDNFTFQSRNRGSFDFKHVITGTQGNPPFRFNLVIEVLLISRCLPCCHNLNLTFCFNLVIEVLLISSNINPYDLYRIHFVSIS